MYLSSEAADLLGQATIRGGLSELTGEGRQSSPSQWNLDVALSLRTVVANKGDLIADRLILDLTGPQILSAAFCEHCRM